MRLLIVSSTQMEIAPFLSTAHPADVLITGVGAAHCMYALTKRLGERKYDFVLQAGIAGSFGELPLCDVSYVRQDCFADLGIYENHQLQSLFNAGFIKPDEPPYTGGMLVNDNVLFQRWALKTCNAVTVNTVSDNVAMEKCFKELYFPHIETMEGAALHYVCLMEGIPFLQLRAVSNIVGIRDKSQWRIKESVTALNHELIKIVGQLKQVL